MSIDRAPARRRWFAVVVVVLVAALAPTPGSAAQSTDTTVVPTTTPPTTAVPPTTAPVPPTTDVPPTPSVPAPPPPATEAGSYREVADEAGYRAALAELSAVTQAEPITQWLWISITEDFTITDPAGEGDPTYTGTLPLIIQGYDDLLRTVTGDGTGRFLAVASTVRVRFEDLVLTGFGTDGDGGAVHTLGGVTATGTELRDNRAEGDGGGLAAGGWLVLSEVTVEGNEAGGDGGGLHTDGNVDLEVGEVNGNTATGSGGGIDAGGWAFLTTVGLADNGATLDGGAVRAPRVGAYASTLTGNDAGRDGGAVRAVEYLDARFSTLEANSAGRDGGAVRSVGDVYSFYSTFADNAAGRDGGAGSAGQVDVDEGSAFLRNTAGGSGGALKGEDWVVLYTAHLADNRAGTASSAGGDGGAVVSEGPVDVERSQIEGNRAGDDPDDDGGGIYAPGTVTVLRTTFAANQAGGRGGAVAASVVDATNTTVAENAAGVSGGGLHAPFVDLHYATVVGNRAPEGANVTARGVQGLWAAASVLARPTGSANCEVSTTGSRGDNWSDDASCGLTHGADVQDGDDPGLGALRDNGGPGAMTTMFPLVGSPLIDRARRVEQPGRDARGQARPFGAGYDIGAVEAVYPPVWSGFRYLDVPPVGQAAVRWVSSWINQPRIMGGDLDRQWFGYANPLLRAALARTLYRAAGAPDVSSLPAHGFTDVPAAANAAVTWAADEGIMTGLSPTTFGPTERSRRGQVVLALYRFAGSPDTTGLADPGFTDVPAWLRPAVTWAAHHGLVAGHPDGTFRSTDTVTRGTFARWLYAVASTPAAWADPGSAPPAMLF